MKSGNWHRGILDAADRFMTSWHRGEAERADGNASRQRAPSAATKGNRGDGGEGAAVLIQLLF